MKFNEGKAPISRDLAFRILEESVRIQPFRDTSLVAVRVRMEDGGEAAVVANEIVRVYREYRLEQKCSQVKQGMEMPAGGPNQQRNPVEIIDPAQPSMVPVSPNLFLNMTVAIGVAGGLFLAGLISVFVGVASSRKKVIPPIVQ